MFDVVVVGAGMIGRAMLHALQHPALKIACIEKQPLDDAQIARDARAITLSPSSIMLLKRLALWPLLKDHATPIKKIRISHQRQMGVGTLSAKEAQVDALGYVIPAHHLHRAFMQSVAGVEWLCPASVDAVRQEQDKVTLSLQLDGKTCSIDTRLVLATDGQRSSVARHVGIEHQLYPYEQVALVATVQLKVAHQHTAYERFLGNGALAMLPLANRRAGVVWAIPKGQGETVNAWSNDELKDTLMGVFGSSLGSWSSLSSRLQFPLSGSRARSLGKHRVVLLGNAANCLHPIAGQGLNLGLRDVLIMAALCADVIGQRRDFGAPGTILERYQRQRCMDHDTMFSFTHKLHGQGQRAGFLSGCAWHAGIGILEHVTPLKQLLMRMTMGKMMDIEPWLSRWLQQTDAVYSRI